MENINSQSIERNSDKKTVDLLQVDSHVHQIPLLAPASKTFGTLPSISEILAGGYNELRSASNLHQSNRDSAPFTLPRIVHSTGDGHSQTHTQTAHDLSRHLISDIKGNSRQEAQKPQFISTQEFKGQLLRREVLEDDSRSK